MSNVIITYGSNRTHIIEHVPDGYLPVRTRCSRTIQNYHLGSFSPDLCSKCGSESDYDEIYEKLSAEYRQKEQARKEQMELSKQKEQLATEQRKEIAFRIAEFIVENFNSQIIQVDNWARCDNYILEIEGHKFQIKPVL